MLKKSIIISLMTLVLPFAASAINVGRVTTIIPADKQLVAKEIKNESPMARVISVKIERIDSPLTDGKVIAFDKKDEILLSPSQLMMPGSSKNIIKFWYQGTEDNQERYYRITFTDEPITDDSAVSGGKSVLAQAKAIISTILVVQPRNKNLDYSLTDDGVSNKGNTSFRVSAIGECIDGKKDCREVFYVLPGKIYRLHKVNLKAKGTHLSLWDVEHYIALK